MNEWLKDRKEFFLITSLMLYTIGSKVLKFAWADGFQQMGAIIYYACILLLLICLGLGFLGDIELSKKCFIKYAVYACIGLIFAYSALNSKDLAMLINIVFILMLKDVSFNKILRAFFYTTTITLLVMFALCVLGVLDNIGFEFLYGTAYALGLLHPNNTAAYILAIVVSGWYLYLREKPLIAIPVIALATLVEYFVFISRTNVIILLLMIVGIVIAPLMKKIKPSILAGLVILLLFVMLAISFYFSYEIDFVTAFVQQYYNVLYTLRDRFEHANYFLVNYPLNLFGNYLIFIEDDAYCLDLFYVWIVIKYGILPALLHFACIIKGIVKNKSNYYILLPIVLFLIMGLMEDSVAYVFYNPFLFVAFSAVESLTDHKNDEKTSSDIN